MTAKFIIINSIDLRKCSRNNLDLRIKKLHHTSTPKKYQCKMVFSSCICIYFRYFNILKLGKFIFYRTS